MDHLYQEQMKKYMIFLNVIKKDVLFLMMTKVKKYLCFQKILKNAVVVVAEKNGHYHGGASFLHQRGFYHFMKKKGQQVEAAVKGGMAAVVAVGVVTEEEKGIEKEEGIGIGTEEEIEEEIEIEIGAEARVEIKVEIEIEVRTEIEKEIEVGNIPHILTEEDQNVLMDMVVVRRIIFTTIHLI
jgi:hypothetical protein